MLSQVAPATKMNPLIPKRSMRIQLSAQEKSINATAPAWSPDGQTICFSGTIPGIEVQVYCVNADGTGSVAQKTTPANVNGSSPSLSPDGSQIVFQTSRDGNNEIYVMNPDGTGLQRLTTNLARDVNPAWSPDGTKIAFESDRTGNDEIFGNLDAIGRLFGIGPSLGFDALKAAVALGVAVASWHLIERPILGLKHRFAYRSSVAPEAVESDHIVLVQARPSGRLVAAGDGERGRLGLDPAGGLHLRGRRGHRRRELGVLPTWRLAGVHGNPTGP